MPVAESPLVLVNFNTGHLVVHIDILAFQFLCLSIPVSSMDDLNWVWLMPLALKPVMLVQIRRIAFRQLYRRQCLVLKAHLLQVLKWISNVGAWLPIVIHSGGLILAIGLVVEVDRASNLRVIGADLDSFRFIVEGAQGAIMEVAGEAHDVISRALV